jgi:hypothetical protein
MLIVVTGLGLFTSVDIKIPIAPNKRFNSKVYNDRIKKALMLKGPFLTNSIHIKPAIAVTRFNKKT